jgi:hypothetical protein
MKKDGGRITQSRAKAAGAAASSAPNTHRQRDRQLLRAGAARSRQRTAQWIPLIHGLPGARFQLISDGRAFQKRH